MLKHLMHISIIVVLTGCLYAPSLHNDFIWDDDEYVYNNIAVQSPEGLKEIWFSYQMPQYYPVVFTTFWLEHKIWGLEPFGFHAVNLLIHIGNALLVYLLLQRLYPPLALAAGLLFALHPLQVETVAWVTERKNLLGCLFYLLATLSYIKYFESGKRRHYGFSLGAFVLALLSKSITVTFVVVPLFIKWWRREKLSRGDFLALLPFGVIGALCAANTIYLEIYRVGAQGETWVLSYAEHLILAGQIVLFYLGKILYPADLIFFYPKWQLDAGQLLQWMPLLLVVSAGVLLYRTRERIGRGAFANYLYAICALFPALGFFNVYPMRYSYVADHFQYIASINLILLLSGAGAFLFERMQRAARWYPTERTRGAILYATLAIVAWLYGANVVEHGRAFANLEAQWQAVIRKNPGSWIAHNNLGLVYRDQGRVSEAVAEFRKAIELDPGNVIARNNLAIYYASLGKSEEALAEFKNILKVERNYANVYNNIGLVYLDTGRMDEAFRYLREAVTINPGLVEAHYNLARYYQANRLHAQAAEELHIAIGYHPRYFDAMCQLANTYELLGEINKAVYWYRQALAVDGNSPVAHNALGNLFARSGQFGAAIAEYQAALQRDAVFVEALVNLGQAYLMLGEQTRALPVLHRAIELGAELPPQLRDFVSGGEAGKSGPGRRQ